MTQSNSQRDPLARGLERLKQTHNAVISKDLSHLDVHSDDEEVANSVIHGIGAGLAAAALAVLVTFAAMMGDPWRIVSFSIYGTTLVLLYTVSTLYHGFRNPRLKELFRIFDAVAIYLLIAGSYTPFMLVTLRGVWGWSLFGVIWGFAVLGIIQAVLFVDRFKLLSLVAYVGMGWLLLIALKPLIAAVPAGGLVWLGVGGMFYTVGMLFYVSKRVRYHHAIWHLFVLAGSLCHFIMMMLYVLPE